MREEGREGGRKGEREGEEVRRRGIGRVETERGRKSRREEPKENNKGHKMQVENSTLYKNCT